MAGEKPSWLESVSEWAYRLDTAQDLWPLIKDWGVPVVSGLLIAFLRGHEHFPLSEVFLFGLVGFAAALVVVRHMGARVQERKAQQDVSPRQTVEILEEGRKAQALKREGLITKWRAMVFEIHSELKSSHTSLSITDRLEQHEAFLTFSRYMSDHTRDVLHGKTFVVPPSQSTMNGSLHCVLHDIDALAQQWGID